MRGTSVRQAALAGLLLLVAATGTGRAEQGFDEKYQRDFNIFNSINQYQPTNPLNPINAYDPANPFNPINRFDPGNPANPIKQFNLNNPFDPMNRWVEMEQMAYDAGRWLEIGGSTAGSPNDVVYINQFSAGNLT